MIFVLHTVHLFHVLTPIAQKHKHQERNKHQQVIQVSHEKIYIYRTSIKPEEMLNTLKVIYVHHSPSGQNDPYSLVVRDHQMNNWTLKFDLLPQYKINLSKYVNIAQ